MRILLIAATGFEVKDFASKMGILLSEEPGMYTNANNKVAILITGVGMVNTAYACGRCITNDFDLIINAGICGAFNRNVKLGENVIVVEDAVSEMGAEDGKNFVPYREMGLPGTNIYLNESKFENSSIKKLRKVKGITVNKVHGDIESIAEAYKRWQPDVESMEGAAFFNACAHWSIPYIQIRSVSNYVEKRDRSKWKLDLAIKNLNELLFELTKELNPE